MMLDLIDAVDDAMVDLRDRSEGPKPAGVLLEQAAFPRDISRQCPHPRREQRTHRRSSSWRGWWMEMLGGTANGRDGARDTASGRRTFIVRPAGQSGVRNSRNY